MRQILRSRWGHSLNVPWTVLEGHVGCWAALAVRGHVQQRGTCRTMSHPPCRNMHLLLDHIPAHTTPSHSACHRWLQLAALTELQELGLMQLGDPPAEQLGELSCLADLQLLELSSSRQLPPGLARLTSLRALHIADTPVPDQPDVEAARQSSASLAATLLPLARLTELALCNIAYAASLPVSLGCLSQLQRFAWHGFPLEDPALPAGPWLASLRWLSVPADAAACSMPALAAASNLEFLAARDFGSLPGCKQLPLVHWTERHPALKTLCLGTRTAKVEMDCEVLEALLGAQRRRPDLLIEHTLPGAQMLDSQFS